MKKFLPLNFIYILFSLCFQQALGQVNNAYSVLNYFRKIVKLRKDNLVLVYGRYTLLDKNNPKVYAYARELDGQKMLLLLNFSASTAQANIGSITTNANVLLSNYKNSFLNNKIQPHIALRPYEAIIYKL